MTLSWRVIHGVWITVVGREDPTDEQLAEHLQAALRERPTNTRGIVVSDGGAPSRAQIEQFQQATVDSQSPDGMPLAVCVDSGRARASYRALGWAVGYDIEFFPAGVIGLADAMVWLRLDSTLQTAVAVAVEDMKR